MKSIFSNQFNILVLLTKSEHPAMQIGVQNADSRGIIFWSEKWRKNEKTKKWTISILNSGAPGCWLQYGLHGYEETWDTA